MIKRATKHVLKHWVTTMAGILSAAFVTAAGLVTQGGLTPSQIVVASFLTACGAAMKDPGLP